MVNLSEEVKFGLSKPDYYIPESRKGFAETLFYSHADSYISKHKVEFVKKIFEIKGLYSSLEKEINSDKVSNKTKKFKI